MELAIQVQILDEVICISLCANALGEYMEGQFTRAVEYTNWSSVEG